MLKNGDLHVKKCIMEVMDVGCDRNFLVLINVLVLGLTVLKGYLNECNLYRILLLYANL